MNEEAHSTLTPMVSDGEKIQLGTVIEEGQRVFPDQRLGKGLYKVVNFNI